MVLGRPDVAELLEAELRESPAFETVHVNPVTGRLLIYHDTAMGREEADQLVRKAVRVVRQAMALTRLSKSEPGAVPARRVPHRGNTASSSVLASGVAAALVLGRSLRRSRLTRLGAVLTATVVVVRRAWRKSTCSQHASTVSTQSPLLQIVGSHKRQLYLASFLSILGQVLEAALFLFFGWVISVVTAGKSATLVRLGLSSASSQLWFLAGVTALVCAICLAVSSIAGMFWRDLAQSVQHEWRTKIYAHVQKVELRYLEGERTTRIVKILTNDINQLGHFFATSANDILQLGTGFLILVPVFLILAPGITWIALLPVPLIAWLSFSHHERVAAAYAASNESGSLLNSHLINNLDASATVKSFAAEEYEIDRIYRLSVEHCQSNRRIDTRTTSYAVNVRACAMISMTGILLWGGLDVLSGALSFEVFNALIGMPSLILARLPGLGNAVDQYQQTVTALGRVLELQKLPVESAGTGQRLDVAAIRGEMVLDAVTFAYPGRRPVLQNLSLRISAKKTTGIVGVTGAGKTTIAKLLLRFQDVTSGQVFLDGVNVRDVRLQDLRKAIGFVGQDAFLFDGTVGDNIRYGSFEADFDRVMSAARSAEADSFVEALPAQYDTMVGERGVTLSGGQKQRISLARAILKSAPIVILDEATSAVDNETEAAIQRALADFARDRTMVIIAHRLSTIRHADWIYVMGKGGVVVEGGTHQDLLEQAGVYASLWRLQIGEVSS
jgi:ATP-binding cassette subfamily B protein